MKPVSIALVGADASLLESVGILVGMKLPPPEAHLSIAASEGVYGGADLPELDILTEALENYRAEQDARNRLCSFVARETPFSALARVSLLHEAYGKLPQILPNMLRLMRTTQAIQTLSMLGTLHSYSAIYALPVADDAPDRTRLLDKQMRMVLETLEMPYTVVYGTPEEIAAKIVAQVEEAAATMDTDAPQPSDTHGPRTQLTGEVASVPQDEGEVSNVSGNRDVQVPG